MMATRLIKLFAWVVPFAVSGQEPDSVNALAAKYKGYLSVFSLNSQELIIDIRKDSVYAVNNYKEQLIHLSDKSSIYSSRSVSSSHFMPVSKISAESSVMEGKKRKVQKVKEFLEKSDQDRNVFYDDSKVYEFTFPQIRNGTVTTLAYTRELKDARLLPGFYFQAGLPVMRAEFTVKVHKDIDLAFQLFNADSFNVEYSKKEEKNFVIHKWIKNNISPYDEEPGAPDDSYNIPHLQFYIKSYKANGKTTRVLTDLTDLHNWYRTFIRHISQADIDSLEQFSGEIVKGKNTPEEKAKAIYYWVQENINYIAFEDGMRGFVPYKPAETFNRKYGDCKDMAVLLYCLLTGQGLKAYPTWIGTNNLPYAYSDIPSPIVDNHMIVTLEMDGKYYFLDATSKYSSFAVPANHIQGKEALASVSQDKFKILKVPFISADRNSFEDRSTLTVFEKSLTGQGRIVVDGWTKEYTAYNLHGLNKEKEKEVISSITLKGGKKFFINSYDYSNLLNRDSVLTLNYNFRIEDHIKAYDDEMYVNLNLDRTLENDYYEIGKRKLPREYSSTFSTYSEEVLNIPEGYQVEFLPVEFKYDGKDFGGYVGYEKKANVVIYRKKIFVNKTMITPGEFEEWNEFTRGLSAAYRESIILKKKK